MLDGSVLASVPDGAVVTDDDVPTEKAPGDDTLETVIWHIRVARDKEARARIEGSNQRATIGKRLEEARVRVKAGQYVVKGRRGTWVQFLAEHFPKTGDQPAISYDVALRNMQTWTVVNPDATEAEREKAQRQIDRRADAAEKRYEAECAARSAAAALAAETRQQIKQARPVLLAMVGKNSNGNGIPLEPEAAEQPEPVDTEVMPATNAPRETAQEAATAAGSTAPDPVLAPAVAASEPAPVPAPANAIKLDQRMARVKSQDENEADECLMRWHDLSGAGQRIFCEKAGLVPERFVKERVA